MDRSLPGSSIHGIFQARVLEWVAIAFSVINATKRLLEVKNFMKCLKEDRICFWKDFIIYF